MSGLGRRAFALVLTSLVVTITVDGRVDATEHVVSPVDPIVTVERGAFNYVGDAAAAGPDDIWGVGFNGLMHSDGHSWSLVRSFPQSTNWRAIDVIGSTGWAVGGCATLRYDGADWHREDLPWDCDLTHVQIRGSTVWAAGSVLRDEDTSESFLLMNDGHGWTVVDHPKYALITAMFFGDEHDGWLSVYDSDTDRHQLLHYQDGSWVEDLTGYPIRAIHGSSDADLWAVGGTPRRAGPARQVILHYSGDGWDVVSDTTGVEHGALADVWMAGPSEGWAAGEFYQIYRYDGVNWDLAADMIGARFDEQYTSIVPVSPSDIWFVGPASRLTHWSDERFVVWGGGRAASTFSPGLTGLAVDSSESAWAVGTGGPTLRRTSDGWREVTCAVCDKLDGVVLGREGGAVAWSASLQGKLVLLDDESARTVSVPSQLPIRRVRVAENGDLWVLASANDQPLWRSEILVSDGLSWTTTLTVTDTALYGLDVARGQAWAVGARLLPPGTEEAALWRFVDGKWGLLRDHGAPGPLTDIAMAPDGTGWAIGWQFALRVDDGVASIESPPWRYPQDGLHAVASSVDGAWIAGALSAWERDNGEWRSVEIPYTGNMPWRMSSVTVSKSADAVWYAGKFETVVRVGRNAVVPSPTATSDSVERAFVPWSAREGSG